MTSTYGINLALSIRASNSSIFENLLEQVKHYAPFVAERFWGAVKNNSELEAAHIQANYDDCEASYKLLTEKLIEVLQSQLSSEVAQEILYNNKTYQTHCEVAQASMLEPHDEQAVWAAWEHQDGQAAYDEKFEMYYNEY